MTRKAGSPFQVIRRHAFAALGAPALVSQAGSQALRPVTFTLPWLAEGSNLFAHVAKSRGFFAEAGLDVTTIPGDRKPDRAAVMTNALIGPVSMTTEEWARAAATSAEFGAILA